MAAAASCEIQREPFIFAFENKEFLLTHTQFANEKYLKSGKYDVIIYGHTHKPDVRRVKDTLIVNPGETGGWVTGKSTVALLDPVSLEAEIVFL